MSVMGFVLFSTMLKLRLLVLFSVTLLDCFQCTNNAAQHEPDEQKKKDNDFTYYRRDVYYERTVQVEFPVISLL